MRQRGFGQYLTQLRQSARVEVDGDPHRPTRRPAMSTPDADLVVVGLGPGSAEHLTPAARAWLTGTAPVFARTRRHPTVD